VKGGWRCTHLFEPFEPPCEEPVGHRHSDAGVVLVHIDALHLDVFAIQEETFVSVKTNVPHAETGRHLINDFADTLIVLRSGRGKGFPATRGWPSSAVSLRHTFAPTASV
jgi:hypothetical protein